MTSITSMEPLLPPVGTRELDDLVAELIAKANAFAARLHPVLRASVGDLVRSMNCYYSNLIEGHNTTPVDINRAMAGDYSNEPEKRNLQEEARAHIEVQAMIDAGKMPFPVLSVEGILWIHAEFCKRMPEDLLWATNPDTNERIALVPGDLRQQMVRVGRHVPPEPEMLLPLLNRFVEAYGSRGLSTVQRIIGIAASHHRLAWIHPFLDGNGRVTRLFSHARLREEGVGSELWSVSRGLARSVEEYKSRLEAADEPRRGDLDGRGNLTEAGLIAFCRYFLRSCVDQVTFMESLMEPRELINRITIWAEEEIRAQRLPKGSLALLREAIINGEFARGMAADLTHYQPRQASTVLNALIDRGLLVSPTPKGKVRLGFPPEITERWLPLLYPVA
ncbi:Fic family protein [Aestuariivirga litoralis]|uniref:Fic family protein n=1 Tax=Aestuariivirga litoralis TaxID=2650924 RepID=UPI0018C67C5D|nr:Fic family protein [Aestuariivirga litoralis]MBG1233971.1 Fic family protein [Aestuariivirga litoralis]